MKKITTYIATLSFMFAACTGSTVNDREIDMDHAKASKSVVLLNEEGSPTCKIDIDLLYAKESDISKEMNATICREMLEMEKIVPQKAVDSTMNEVAREYKNDCLAFYRADQVSEIEMDKSLYMHTFFIKTSTKTLTPGILAYTMKKEVYRGGRDKVTTFRRININKDTGKNIKLKELFMRGFERELEQILFAALLQKEDCSSKKELNEKYILMNCDIYVPNNFLIKENSISFFFNPGEIAPMSHGEIELQIELNNLEGIMNK